MKDIFQSKVFKGIILGIAGLVILSFVFCMGVYVGTKRADFAFKWAEEYHRNFAGPKGGFFGDLAGGDFGNANGVFGQLIKIDGQNLTIKGVDNVEKIIVTGPKTSILYQRKNIKISDLKINENVVVIGDPDNNSQIQAELIRVMPMAPQNINPNLQNNQPLIPVQN